MQPELLDFKAATDLFKDSVQRATGHQLSIADLISCATRLDSSGQKQFVAELYKTWIAHNSGDNLLHAAYFNFAVVLADLGDRPGAINALQECIRLKPDFYPSYINLGRVFEDSGQPGAAVTQWLKLVQNLAVVNGETVAHKISALEQIARVLESANSDAPAEDALRQSLDINPHQTKVVQHWISLRQRQCKWPVISEWDRVSRKNLLTGISSLSLQCLADDPVFQLAKAYHYGKSVSDMPKVTQHAPAGRRDADKLRIGYVSSDLREHAVGFAMTDVIEQHNREKFEIFAYYCGVNRTDATQQRIKGAVDHWADINGLDDDQAAAKIAADGIDILVDLNGYTKDARTSVFARKPAPVAVNWFGFPGTMGTPFHHYIIADSKIVPPEHEIHFSEKVLRLPCYQPNDRKRLVAEQRPSRADVGLPANKFVFCSFNGMHKTTARTFRRWMMILGSVPDSVLWLLSATEEANERLREAAVASGIAGDRIVFAKKLPNAEHLARYPLADLFLDSSPYGAHTTAADSLWMGVPIVTFAGRTFAARVCASVVHAAGVGELDCPTPEAYVAKAIELAHNPEKLAAIKAKLVAGRDSCLLFDTSRLVRDLEDLYRQMWSDFRRGALPVPDLHNLDVYHEIGLGLDLENIETLSDDSYISLYQEKLEAWHNSYPIRPDNRLWLEAEKENRLRLGHLAVA
ncbi:MAG TPA: glycosyl transferase [Pseudolabrys sp.]|nr:glycosyl transferase [Pseudolabrys sp.]